jgi:hypothetical protein
MAESASDPPPATVYFLKAIYSGCQKNVLFSVRFFLLKKYLFLQPLMPQSFIPEHFYGKGYK